MTKFVKHPEFGFLPDDSPLCRCLLGSGLVMLAGRLPDSEERLHPYPFQAAYVSMSFFGLWKRSELEPLTSAARDLLGAFDEVL